MELLTAECVKSNHAFTYHCNIKNRELPRINLAM